MSFDVFCDALPALGTIASKLRGIEKNVVDGVVLELVQKTASDGKVDSDKIKGVLDGLLVNKIHVPGYKRVKIRYEDD